MRRALAFLLVLLSVTVVVSASLRITEFRVKIDALETGELAVSERLDVDFYTPHHGIIREIPYSYRRSAGERLTVDLDLVSISHNEGTVPYTTRRSGGTLILRIGDPNKTVSGTHTYTICYKVNRALLFNNEDYIQLYWNVTGNDWQIPIDHVTALVSLPEGVTGLDVPTISYVGYSGNTTRGQAAQLDSEGRFMFEAGALSPGEGLTIDVAIPREASGITAPTAGQRALWFLGANKYAFLPIIALVGMFLVWYYKGKDPRKGTIAPRFEPPRGMHPGEAGVLIDDRADLRDISAMVIGLAVKGYLKIKEVREEELGLAAKVKELFKRSSPVDFEFIKRKDGDDELSKVEKTLFDAIFDADHQEKRSLSSMENEFYKVLPTIKSNLYAGLIKQGYYPHNPERIRRSNAGLGLMILVGGIALGVGAASLYLGISIVICGLIVLAFSPIMPRKTTKGVGALRDLLGLAEYIGRAEVEKMEFHDAPEKSPQLFEKLLPYAIALNLTSIWTKQFEGMFEQPPEWYAGASPVFSGHLFALSMMHLSSGMERTFVSAPRTSSSGRSAWGGGSSFGGGFSGGGFGGGGGGGW